MHDSPREISESELNSTFSQLGSWPLKLSAGIGGLGILGMLALGLKEENQQQFLFSYLMNFSFFLSLSIGALFFVSFQHITRAGWSVVVRRIAEFLAMGIVPLFLLSLPIIYTIFSGSNALYSWNSSEELATSHLLQSKQGYLNQGFFLVRWVVYFAAWYGVARYYFNRSTLQDKTKDKSLTLLLERRSAPFIFVLAFTATFAAFDWLMALDYKWFSTIFGVYFFAGGTVFLFAALILISNLYQAKGLLKNAITTEHFHDMGKLLFGFNCFWAYIAFSQYILIWYANIPEETEWYHIRIHGGEPGGWFNVAMILVFGHFIIPFVLFMSRTMKRTRPILIFWAIWLVVMHWIDMYWLVMPTLHHEGPDWSHALLDLCCLLGVGGIYFTGVCYFAADRPLLPVGDPRLQESLAFENY